MHIPLFFVWYYSVDQVVSLNNDQIHFKKTSISLLSKNHKFASILKFKFISISSHKSRLRKYFNFKMYVKTFNIRAYQWFFPDINTWPWDFFMRLRFKTHENRQCHFHVSAEGSLLFKFLFVLKVFFYRITELFEGICGV